MFPNNRNGSIDSIPALDNNSFSHAFGRPIFSHTGSYHKVLASFSESSSPSQGMGVIFNSAGELEAAEVGVINGELKNNFLTLDKAGGVQLEIDLSALAVPVVDEVTITNGLTGLELLSNSFDIKAANTALSISQSPVVLGGECELEIKTDGSSIVVGSSGLELGEGGVEEKHLGDKERRRIRDVDDLDNPDPTLTARILCTKGDGASALPKVLIGAGEVNSDCSTLVLSALNSGTSTNVLYIDSNGLVTQDVAPSGAIADGTTIINDGNGFFSASGNFGAVGIVCGGVQMTTGDLKMNYGAMTVASHNDILYVSSSGLVTRGSVNDLLSDVAVADNLTIIENSGTLSATALKNGNTVVLANSDDVLINTDVEVQGKATFNSTSTTASMEPLVHLKAGGDCSLRIEAGLNTSATGLESYVEFVSKQSASDSNKAWQCGMDDTLDFHIHYNTSGSFNNAKSRAEFTIVSSTSTTALDGKVGINVPSPTSALDVGGTLAVSGAANVGGTLAVSGAATIGSAMNVGGRVTASNEGLRSTLLEFNARNAAIDCTGDLIMPAASDSGFIPFVGGSSRVDGVGYRQHVVFGSYRETETTGGAQTASQGGGWGYGLIAVSGKAQNGEVTSDAGPNREFKFKSNGTFEVEGDIKAAGVKNFCIPHPLDSVDSKLRHASIEGPSGDLIYSGTVILVEGKAAVDIDAESRMTPGTFEALCKNTKCFTSNESDWTPVRGTVSGASLSIEAQDPNSTATVSWIVLATRKDSHYTNGECTDDDGNFVVEF